MSDKSWWVTALQWTIWGLLISLVMGWLTKSRVRARPISHARRLTHPPSTLITGAVCVLFFAGLAVVSNVVPNETTTWWTTSIFVGFAILSTPLVLDYFSADHQISEDGLAFRKLVGTRKYLRWSAYAMFATPQC